MCLEATVLKVNTGDDITYMHGVDFSGKLVSATEELQRYKTELASYEEKTEKLETEYFVLKREYDKEVKKEQEASTKCKGFKTMVSDLQKANKKLESSNEELSLEIQECETKYRDSEAKCQACEAKCQELEADNQTLKQQLIEEKKAKETMETKLRNSEEKNEVLTDFIKLLQHTNEQQSKTGHELQRSVSDLSSKVHQMHKRQRHYSEGQQHFSPQLGSQPQSSASGITFSSRKHNSKNDLSSAASSEMPPVKGPILEGDDRLTSSSSTVSQKAQHSPDPMHRPSQSGQSHQQDDSA